MHGDQWDVNDSSFARYAHRVEFIYPSCTLPELVVQQHRDGDVGIDIAGGTNGRALRDLLDSGILSRALVTNFEDRRSEEVKADTRLDHIDGSLLLPATWSRIINWQRTNAPAGLGLVLHRPCGGLQGLPTEHYRRAADQLIDMLRPGGLLFAQVPAVIARRSLKEDIMRIQNRPDVARVHLTPMKAPRDLHVAIIKAGIVNPSHKKEK